MSVKQQRQTIIVQPSDIFAKTMTWRILATTDTVIIARLITGSWGAGIAIGGIEIVTKVFLYYLHERGWANLEWGIVRESFVSS